MDQELKPCPFCDGPVCIRTEPLVNSAPGHQIEHERDVCFVDIGMYQDRAELIELWNRRANPWISVSDRLPDEGQNVLVVRPGGQRMIDWHSGGRWRAAWSDAPKPTHWQPLPAAPKAGA